jgi:hypothetical protein
MYVCNLIFNNHINIFSMQKNRTTLILWIALSATIFLIASILIANAIRPQIKDFIAGNVNNSIPRDTVIPTANDPNIVRISSSDLPDTGEGLPLDTPVDLSDPKLRVKTWFNEGIYSPIVSSNMLGDPNTTDMQKRKNLKQKFGFDGIDVIVTDSLTDKSILDQLNNLQPVHRDFLWLTMVHRNDKRGVTQISIVPKIIHKKQ